MRTILSYITIIWMAVFLSCCGNNEKDCGYNEKDNTSSKTTSSIAWNQATKVEYRYGDSSVPPVYHRSYTIAITDSLKVITIDSYGDILLTRQYPNNSSNFQAFKEKLSQKGISKHEKTNDNGGCAGGTSEYIRLYEENEKFFDGYVYHCQGDDGDLYLPDGTSDLFRIQIPEDVNSLIESTRTR